MYESLQESVVSGVVEGRDGVMAVAIAVVRIKRSWKHDPISPT